LARRSHSTSEMIKGTDIAVAKTKKTDLANRGSLGVRE
jgi:hypothetical protein